MSPNALMLLLLAGVILVLLGIGVFLGALSLYIVGYLIAGAKFSVLGIPFWRPVLQDLFIVFLQWKVISVFAEGFKNKAKLVLLTLIPVWVAWKLFGEWLMASALGLGLSQVAAQEAVMHISAVTGNPIVWALLAILFVFWVIKNL